MNGERVLTEAEKIIQLRHLNGTLYLLTNSRMHMVSLEDVTHVKSSQDEYMNAEVSLSIFNLKFMMTHNHYVIVLRYDVYL